MIVLAVMAIFSCSENGRPRMTNPPKHVILVGLDGMSATSIRNGADVPTLRKLMKNGSYTLYKR